MYSSSSSASPYIYSLKSSYNNNRSRNKKNSHDIKENICKNTMFNSNLLSPSCEEEIALHPKKLNELKNWLQSRMAISRGSKTLLLTGPSGSGKNTAVKILCAQLGIEVTEWDFSEEYNLRGEQVTKQSALNNFVQFLQNTEFFSIQRMSLKHRLLLIGQLPSPLIREPKCLHEILAKVVPNSRCFIVFILPNVDSCWELNPVRLFPQSVVDSLGITHIKTNPISITLMIAAIKRASEIFHINISTEYTKQIANLSNGDIRRAINLLLLSNHNRNEKAARKQNYNHNTAKRLRLEVEQFPLSKTASGGNLSWVTQQSPQLELFHFIGKVMYAKRAESADQRWEQIEKRLHPSAWRKYARPLPPKDDLNWLIETAPISAQMLSSYVFEHEPRFAPSLNSISRVVETLSTLDALMGSTDFEHRATIEKYMLDLSVRSSLLYNYCNQTTKMPKRNFYQFEKPRMYDMPNRNFCQFEKPRMYDINIPVQKMEKYEDEQVFEEDGYSYDIDETDDDLNSDDVDDDDTMRIEE